MHTLCEFDLTRLCLAAAITTINDFVFKTKIDNINMFKLEKYIKKSEIVKKVFY